MKFGSNMSTNILEQLGQLAEHYKDLYPIPCGTLLQNTISLIVSQQVKFSQGRVIRKRLYELIDAKTSKTSSGSTDTDTILRSLTHKDWKDLGLTPNKISTILEITSMSNLSVDNLDHIKGIGPWTIKALKVLTNSDPNVFLSEDLWIRKRFSELVGTRTLSSKELDEMMGNSDTNSNLTQVSRFLWRLKPENVQKLVQSQELSREDFV